MINALSSDLHTKNLFNRKKKMPNKAVSSLSLSICPVGCKRVRMVQRSLWPRACVNGPPLLFPLAAAGGRAPSKPPAWRKPFPSSVSVVGIHLQWYLLAGSKAQPPSWLHPLQDRSGEPACVVTVAAAETTGPHLPPPPGGSGRNTVSVIFRRVLALLRLCRRLSDFVFMALTSFQTYEHWPGV